MTEEVWEDSKQFQALREKKRNGELVKALLDSAVYRKCIEPYCQNQIRGAKSKEVGVLSNHAELVVCCTWRAAHEAMLDALAETAKDAEIDLSKPPEAVDEGPGLTEQ